MKTPEYVDLEENPFKTFVTNRNVESLIDSKSYEEGEEYYVTIGRMTCGKYNMYFAHGYKKGSGQSYRVYNTLEDMEKDFTILE